MIALRQAESAVQVTVYRADQTQCSSRSAGRRRVTSVVYMIRKRPTFAGILRIFAVREVRKLAECLASFTTVRSCPAGDEIKPGRRAKEWIAAVDRRGHRDTSSVGGTARGTSARDGLSALIGRTAPPVRLGRFHLVSDGARGCRAGPPSPAYGPCSPPLLPLPIRQRLLIGC